MLKVSFLDLLDGELSVSVLVERAEDLGEVLALFAGKQLGGDERVGSLLEGLVHAEGLHVVEHAQSEGFVNSEVGQLGEPRVPQRLGRGGSLILIVSEELRDEVLRLVRHVGPDLVIEVELTLSDLAHNFLVAGAVEGRHAGEEDVGDDSRRPDVTLAVVVLVEHLGRDVVGRAEFLVKRPGGVEDEGGAEVDDLDLVELFVLLKQDVLGLEISENASI